MDAILDIFDRSDIDRDGVLSDDEMKQLQVIGQFFEIRLNLFSCMYMGHHWKMTSCRRSKIVSASKRYIYHCIGLYGIE